MVKHRKHYTPEEKVAILRRHLVEKAPVSDLCQEQKLQPTVFYRWLKEFFENGAAAFRREGERESREDKERIAAAVGLTAIVLGALRYHSVASRQSVRLGLTVLPSRATATLGGTF